MKLKIEVPEHMLKKIVLEDMFSKTIDTDLFLSYFYLDEVGSPIFVIETKE